MAVAIPAYNAATTLSLTLDSLLREQELIDELIIIDNNSADGTLETIQNQMEAFRCNKRCIRHTSDHGLAKSYNEAFLISECELVVTLHADIQLRPGALAELIKPFADGLEVSAASTHVVDHPFDIWVGYNFWQKCLFSRFVGKKYSGLDGKFDCFRRSIMLSIGLFDAEHFRTAGEDGDIIMRLRKHGGVVQTEAEIIHLHVNDPRFSFSKLKYKHAQYADAQGALLRKHGMPGMVQFLKMFFREILAIGALIPLINFIVAPLIVIYVFSYTWTVYKYEWKNPRILLLPFVNILLLYVSLVNSVRGYTKGRQTK